MRSFEIVAIPVLSLLASCTFLANSGHDAYGRSFADLTRLIERMEEARTGDLTLSDWREREDVKLDYYGDSWEIAIGSVYARRSTASVRHNPYWSMTGTMFVLWAEAPWFVMFPIGGLIFAPIELIASPYVLCKHGIQHSCVEDEALASSLADIERARRLGFVDERATRDVAWPTYGSWHLDMLGFDAAHLRTQ